MNPNINKTLISSKCFQEELNFLMRACILFGLTQNVQSILEYHVPVLCEYKCEHFFFLPFFFVCEHF